MARKRQQQLRRIEAAVPPPRRAPLIAVAAAALAAFVLLALGDMLTSSPTSDELPHVVAGYSYWVAGDYRLNPEHPPLLKAFAALPLLAMDVWPAHLREARDGEAAFGAFREAWAMCVSNPTTAEWAVSQFVLYGLRDSALQRAGGDAIVPPTTAAYTPSDFLNRPDRMFLAARVMMLLITVALAATIFSWSYSLWGLPGAVVSLLLFCFDPNFIAHGGLVTTDVGASFLICAAAYFFWRSCVAFTPRNVVLFAFAFALAEIAKFSAVLLIPMLLVTAIIEIVRTKRVQHVLIALGAAAITTIIVIWAAYGFRYSAVPDRNAAVAEEQAVRANPRIAGLVPPGTWPTGSMPLRDAIDLWYAEGRLRTEMPNGYTEAELRQSKRTTPTGFAGRAVLFCANYHLLPESFLYGFAWTGASSVTRPAYLKGEYSNYGFPAYFLWTFLYKTPIPLMLFIAGGVIVAIARTDKRPDLLFVALPALVYGVYAFTSTINIGHRHIFPLLPFVYTMAGALGSVWAAQTPRARSILAAVSVILLAISANFVLLSRPASLVNRHISYLNEFAGGPIGGWDKLTDSNFDWGQDQKRLAAWLREHNINEPLDWLVFGNADPRYDGIRYYNYRLDYSLPTKRGYVAISQMGYLGILADAEHRTMWRDFLNRVKARRIGTAGYSIFIYKIDQLP